MSLSLTRRIVRTALLVAAGAAPVVGAAGAASAAVLPTNAPLTGLSTLDKAPVDGVVHSASTGVTRTADQAGGTTVRDAAGAPLTTAQHVAGGAVGDAAAHTAHLPAA